MEWINSKDELPETDLFVDIFLKSTQNSTYGERQTDVLFDGKNFRHRQTWNCVYVSHWMRIPARPTAG